MNIQLIQLISTMALYTHFIPVFDDIQAQIFWQLANNFLFFFLKQFLWKYHCWMLANCTVILRQCSIFISFLYLYQDRYPSQREDKSLRVLLRTQFATEHLLFPNAWVYCHVQINGQILIDLFKIPLEISCIILGRLLFLSLHIHLPCEMYSLHMLCGFKYLCWVWRF